MIHLQLLLNFGSKIVFLMGISFSILFLSSCSSIPLPNVALSDLGILNQNELVTLEIGEQIFAFTARIESDGSRLQLVAITPTGQRLFSFKKQGAQLDAEAGPLWPAAMPLAAVWADFEMVHVERLEHPERVVLAKGWKRIETDDGFVIWLYKGQQQASLQRSVDQTVLTKPQYQLRIEVLPE